MIERLTTLARDQVKNPFNLVSADLQSTQHFAVNNIVSLNSYSLTIPQLKTQYNQIEEVSLYNLKLKGKNFRSAILFTLARAIYSQIGGSTKFEDTKMYHQVVALAACIEIAHNASLL